MWFFDIDYTSLCTNAKKSTRIINILEINRLTSRKNYNHKIIIPLIFNTTKIKIFGVNNLSITSRSKKITDYHYF